MSPEPTGILVVEDEAKTAETVRLYLERAGFRARVERDGRRGLAAARSGEFALVVLDLMLPEIDGLTVCRRLRAETEVKILMLTARSTEDDRVRGLDLGADDYLTKPFSPRELVARVRAVLRRDGRMGGGPAAPGRRGIVRHRGLELDHEARRVTVDGREADLTVTEFDLLAVLAGAPGRVFRRDELIERALGAEYDGSERTIDVHVNNLRRKIEPDRSRPTYVETAFGVGYRMGVDE